MQYHLYNRERYPGKKPRRVYYGKKHSEKYKQFLKQTRQGTGNPMYGKEKSPEFREWMGKPRFGKENFMYEKGKALSVWTTDGSFVGDFSTRKEIIKKLKISKEEIS